MIPKKRVIITGATGMVGGCALKICLEDPKVSQVTTIGRKPAGVDDTKLHEVIVDDFNDYSALTDVLKNQDVSLYCLGAYTGAAPDEEFRRITVDYTLAFAKALKNASPRSSFCFLSGQGADQTEQSRVAFARYKGAAEKELLDLGFSRIHIFRPGYIYPVVKRREPNFFYFIFRFLYPMLRHLYPNIGISSENLAAAMVHVGLHGAGDNDRSILENKDIRFMEAKNDEKKRSK